MDVLGHIVLYFNLFELMAIVFIDFHVAITRLVWKCHLSPFIVVGQYMASHARVLLNTFPRGRRGKTTDQTCYTQNMSSFGLVSYEIGIEIWEFCENTNLFRALKPMAVLLC